MIKADGSAKVKERPAGILKMSLFLLVFSLPAFGQVSESDVQRMEEQEFGIESGQSAKPQAPSPTQVNPLEPPLDDVQQGAQPEKIKPIEAEEFRVKALRKSRSGRVILFEDPSEGRPRPGRILLIKDNKDDVIAVRVLKNYPGKFAAKTVLKFRDAELNGEYRALRKLGYKIMALIRERERQERKLEYNQTDEDLAKEVAPDDNELDRGIPLPTKPAKGKKKQAPEAPEARNKNMPEPLFTKDGEELTSDAIEVTDEDEPYADLSITENVPLEPKNHAISLEYGSLKSVNKENDPASYSGLGLRYNYNFWRTPFIKKKALQDAFSGELSLFYYSITGFVKTDDTVTVYPVVGTLRYNVFIGETFQTFAYLGFVKNIVSEQPDKDGNLTGGTGPLQTTKAALGLGAMMKIGPSWALRIEYGTDIFGVGAVLKF